jgi:hypothetical protein
MTEPTPREILDLAEQIKPFFAGKNPVLIGGALVELASIWLAGHVVRNDPKATFELRAQILAVHVEAITSLVNVNAEMIGAKLISEPPRGRG